MRLLVTGGSGFIGSNVIEHARETGHEVLNIDIAPPRVPGREHYWRRVDILDAPTFTAAVKQFRPDLMLHLAARTDLGGDDVRQYRANTDGVRHAIAAAKHVGVPFTIFASSMLVCRLGHIPRAQDDYCPTTAYGESKVIGEQLVRAEGDAMRWAIVRPTSIWGPWFGSPYRDFFSAVRSGWYLHPKGHAIRRTYGFVLNAVHELFRLAEHAEAMDRMTLYLADYQPIELRSWAEMIRNELAAPRVREVSLRLLKCAAVAGDAILRLGYHNPPLTSFRLDNLLTEMVFDMSTLRPVYGDLPFTTQKGVQLTCDWLRANAP